MGLFDALLGGQKKLKGAAPDRLFAMSTAYVAMETEFSLKSAGAAGLVFQPIATSDFEGILRDAQELLEGMGEETGAKLDSSDDEYGYRWVVLRDPDFDDLVVSLNTLSTELQGGGYGDRLLCAVFGFDLGAAEPGASAPASTGPAGRGDRRAYFIYNFKRGAFYPFVPRGSGKERDNESELRLKAQLENELPLEADTTRWFPLWEIPL